MIRNLWSKPGAILFFYLFLSGLGLGLLLTTKPVYSHISLRTPAASGIFEFPFLEEKGMAAEKILSFDMKVGRFHPNRFAVYARDVVKVIKVNTKDVTWLEQSPFYAQVKASPMLKEGHNLVQVKMLNYNSVAGFYWIPSLWDPWFLTIIMLGLSSLVFGLRWIQLVFPIGLETGEAIVLYLAIVLRLIYTCGTPYSVRAYDWEGHLNFIQYVSKNLAFPALDSGWETFQPPLFYGIYGLFGHIVYMLGGGLDFAIIIWQLLGLTIAALTMAAALWIGRILFPSPTNRWRLLFLASVAIIPSFVFFSSRINNDILFALISFFFLGAFLQFWKSRSLGCWMVISVLIALGLLTKGNSLVFLPVVATSLFFASMFTWKRKALLMAVLLAVIGLVAGWCLFRRAMESKDSAAFVVRNMEKLHPAFHMTPEPLKFITFNPLEMLKDPFAWSAGGPRYEYFLEFFFKSGLFSEGYPGVRYFLPAQCILGCALILLGFGAFGLWRTLRSLASPAWPLFVTVLGFASAQMFGVFLHPYACLENFRYSIILIIPLVYFAIKGIELSQGRLQSLGKIAAGIFIGLSVLFILTQPGVLI